MTDFGDIVLHFHKLALEKAIDDSIRTGVPLVVKRNGKIIKLKPQFKYVKVPIKSSKRKKPDSIDEMKKSIKERASKRIKSLT